MKEPMPKTIHFFWFGKNPKPESVKKCIKSWKKYCPDYEIIEWDEDNYDIDKIKFCKDAYDAKKWAFVTDAARLDVIYEFGGIYFDTDVEVVKNLDDLLGYEAFAGFESDQYVALGLGFGAKPKCKIINELLDCYRALDFSDNSKSLNKISLPIVVTDALNKKGLKRDGTFQSVDGLTIFPKDYFAPKEIYSRIMNITENTYSIHHYDASWVDDKEKSIIEQLDQKGLEMTKKYPTLVSIIIPVYNGENFMRKAIDSALAQTYKNIEVIVINDGSKDNTDKIAKEYGARIKYISKENGGVASAMNVGITNMRGKYFSWLSHDDMYYPEKIEQLIKKVDRKDDNTIVVSDWSIVDENDKVLKNNKLDDILETDPKAFLAFDRKTWLNGCAMLIPASLFKKYGLFDETLRTTQDYEIYHRFMKNNVKFKIVHRPLLYSRVHSQQGSIADPKAIENSDLIHTSIIEDLSIDNIQQYFQDDYAKVLSAYNSFFTCGYKRVPAYLINCATRNFININRFDLAADIIYEKMIGKDVSRSRKDIEKYIKIIKKKTIKKRVLFCSGHWLTGGVERVLSNLFAQLGDEYELYLITPYDERESRIVLPNNVTHIKISNDLFYSHFDTTILSYALLLNIDLVIGCMNLFEGQLNLYHLCKGTKIKTIASNHEYFFFAYKTPLFYGLVEKRQSAFKDADAVLWLTNFSAAAYGEYNNNGYLMANPNTYEVQIDSANGHGKKTIMCVGRFNDYVKRVDRILKCFKIVLEKEPDAKLVLVGKCNQNAIFCPGSSMTIADLLDQLGLRDSNIMFIGETDNMKEYYSNANLLLIASNNEGFSMAINEAASFGLPTVCNFFPGIEDIIMDDKNGYITNQDDIVSMAEKVCNILSDNALSKRLGKNAKNMTTRFNAKSIVDKWRYLIDTVLEDASPEETKLKLNVRLSYVVKDYKKYSIVLANEFNDIFNKCVNNYMQLPSGPSNSITTKGVSYYSRLTNSVKAYGFRSTIKKIFKKVKNKILI